MNRATMNKEGCISRLGQEINIIPEAMAGFVSSCCCCCCCGCCAGLAGVLVRDGVVAVAADHVTPVLAMPPLTPDIRPDPAPAM